MLANLQGIVFKTIKYRESSIISSIYTNKFGLRSYLINGVRSPKSKVSPALFQPGFLVDMVVYHKDGNSVNRIKEIRPGYHYRSEIFDLSKGAVSLFFSEICAKSIHEQEQNIDLFNFLKNAFISLDLEARSVVNFPLIFLIKLSQFLGFEPNLRVEEKGNYFDLEEGAFAEHIPGHFNYLDKEMTGSFKTIMHLDFNRCSAVKVDKEIRNILLDKMLDYYKIHLTDMSEITSHKIFNQVFSV